jgi:hypothetical protein
MIAKFKLTNTLYVRLNNRAIGTGEEGSVISAFQSHFSGDNFHYTPTQQSFKGGILESACLSGRLASVGFFLSAQ